MLCRPERALTLVASLVILAIAGPVQAWPGEDFDERSPYNWSRTMFPFGIPHEHVLSREDPCADTCLLPAGMGFHVTQCTDDREGICRATITTPTCDAFALRRPVTANYLLDSKSTAYIAATGLMSGQVQRVGLVARAATTTIAGATEIAGGYAAIIRVFTGTSSPVEGVVQIVRLDAHCVEASTVLATSSPPFEIVCPQEFHLKFTVVGSTLRATLDRMSVIVPGGGGVLTEHVVMDSVTNGLELVASDSTFMAPGLNGVVGYTQTPGSVYWDDVRIFKLDTITLAGAPIGTVIGGQAGQSPGALVYTEGGLDFRAQTVTPPGMGSQPIFGFGQFVATPSGLGGGSGLRLNDMALHWNPPSGTELNIIFGRLPGATPQDRWVNLTTTGPTSIGSLLSLESDPGDMYDIDPWPLTMPTGGQSFRLDIAASSVSTVTFGGHDVIIDTLHIGAPVTECEADFDNDGVVSVQDIFDYLNAWFAGSLDADTDGSGTLSVQDIFDYLNLWFAGCA